jgi:two-component system chemotaxis response regulator CheY
MKKILIVDDSAFMRSILKDLLSKCVPIVEVFEAEGKASASENLKKHMPDLVLLDVVMKNSEYEGIEILKEIKEFFPNTKVIMVTSVGQVSVVEECKKLGIQQYIEKPFDQDVVLEKVKQYLA